MKRQSSGLVACTTACAGSKPGFIRVHERFRQAKFEASPCCVCYLCELLPSCLLLYSWLKFLRQMRSNLINMHHR